jgi:hypothetical protein
MYSQIKTCLPMSSFLCSIFTFVDHCLSCSHFFSFDYCIVCPSSIYDFWLPLWYFQTGITLFLVLEYTICITGKNLGKRRNMDMLKNIIAENNMFFVPFIIMQELWIKQLECVNGVLLRLRLGRICQNRRESVIWMSILSPRGLERKMSLSIFFCFS